MWNICICDDNKIFIEQMKSQLLTVINSEFNSSEFSINTYTNGTMLIGDVEDESIAPDILFMDIELTDGNGIDYCKNILTLNPYCQIIFVSGFDEYYLDVYDVDHVYFLRKPVKNDDIYKALRRAIQHSSEERAKSFSFTSNSKITVIPLNEILYFEKYRRKIFLHTTDDKLYEFYGVMDDVINEIDMDSFIRCHNSYIVNLNKVTELTKEHFVMGNSIIPISRTYSKETKEKFMGYIEEKLC